MRSRIGAVLLAFAVIAGPAPAGAWDYPGHRIVGAVADLVLVQHYPTAQKRVSALLDKKDANGNVMEKRSLSQVAVFPDCAKRGNVPFCGRPPSEEEREYAARNPHNDKFHYTDVALQQPKYALGSAGTGDIDVVQMIEYAVAQLRGLSPPAKTDVNLTDTEALWLLAHMVGDIHQPLHVGAKYFDKSCENSVDPNVAGQPPKFGIGDTIAETVGGNLIYLTAPAPAVPPHENLHFYWDGTTVVHAMQAAGTAHSELDFAKLIAASPPAGWETAGPPETWAAQWATEIMPLAVYAHDRLVIRKGPKPSPFSFSGGCTWTTTLDPAYQDWAKEQARIQIAKAGFRLAALLKAIFEP
jgi:S1/P1 Nuclease